MEPNDVWIENWDFWDCHLSGRGLESSRPGTLGRAAEARSMDETPNSGFQGC